MCESDLWDRFFRHGPVNSAQCDIATLATTIAWHDGENIIYGLEGNIPTPAMPWHGWLTAPV